MTGPYGYEVPASDYKDIIEDAGLTYAGKFYFGERWTQDFIRSFEGLDITAAERILSFHENNLISSSNQSYMVGFLGVVNDCDEFSHLALDMKYNENGRYSDRQTAALGDALANQVRMLNQISKQETTRADLVDKFRDERLNWNSDQQKLNETIQQKDKVINELSKKLADIGDAEVEIERLNNTVVARDKDIKALQVQRSSEQTYYDSELKRLENLVVERDRTVTSLSKQLSSNQEGYNSALSRLENSLIERDKTINGLNKQMHESNEFNLLEFKRLNAKIVECDEVIDSLNKRLSVSVIQNNSKIDKLEKIALLKDDKIAELHELSKEKQAEIDKLAVITSLKDDKIAELHELSGEKQNTIELQRSKIMSLEEESVKATTSQVALEGSFKDKMMEIERLESSLVKVNERILEQDSVIINQNHEFEKLKAQYELLYGNYELATQALEYERKRSESSLMGAIKRSLMFWQSDKSSMNLLETPLLANYLHTAPVVFDEWKEEILCRRGKSYDVILFPVIDWHFRVQRPQHLVRELAASGHRAFYLTTTFFESTIPNFKVLESPAENVFIVQLGCPTDHPNIYNDTLTEDQQKFLLAGLIKLCTSYKLNAIASIVDLPFWGKVAEALPSSVMVYDCMDHHAGFTTNSEAMLSTEEQVLKESNLVISTSALLAEKLSEKVANTLIRNAGEIAFFSEPPRELKIISNRPVVGYYGAICDWFDIELVVKAAKAHSEWDFALVGNVTNLDISAAKSMPNIKFYGEVPYVDLPGYLYAFDVCTIPFIINDLTLCTNPVKVYEYLAAGKPVVATAMPELKLIEDVCHVSEGHDTFIKDLTIAMAESKDEKLIESRTRWAKNHDWSSRAIELNEVIKHSFPKVSVVVLTYNNLDFTKACLHSLQLYTDYPNWELIIVDNASADESPEFLKEYETLHANVKVILNDENLGFSAGNNVGLEAATGDYLVILNNDTYVTQGWLNGLIKPLDSDSELGIVGPVTNNIGNEAKIEIGYSDMDEMASKAGVYTDAHANELYYVNTVAFFCVAFSRAVFEKVGLMDEDFGVGFFEDDDYCNRVRSFDLKVAIVEDVFVHHHLSASFDKLKAEDKQKLFEKNKIIYEKKWGEWLPHEYR